MNLTKIEPESDSETPEPYSQFQFTNAHQKLMPVPVSFTEMKTEIKVRGTRTGISLDVLLHELFVGSDAVIWYSVWK